jgi:predicted N-acetyltransferase YhbS
MPRIWRQRGICPQDIARVFEILQAEGMTIDMTPMLATDPYDWESVLALIRRAFAGMEGRIEPPSSLHTLTVDGLRSTGEVWVMGVPPVACVILTPRAGALHLGKMAVEPAMQGRGLGQRLIGLAEERARALGLDVLELETRVELVENHAAFPAMGFQKVGETAHPGFARATSYTYRKVL